MNDNFVYSLQIVLETRTREYGHVPLVLSHREVESQERNVPECQDSNVTEWIS